VSNTSVIKKRGQIAWGKEENQSVKILAEELAVRCTIWGTCYEDLRAGLQQAIGRSFRMLSRFSMRWRWYDWVCIAIVIIVIVAAIRFVAPTSGLSQALHQGFHALAIGLQWIASGLSALSQLLGQL
jgi:hypothetical protein